MYFLVVNEIPLVTIDNFDFRDGTTELAKTVQSGTNGGQGDKTVQPPGVIGGGKPDGKAPGGGGYEPDPETPNDKKKPVINK